MSEPSAPSAPKGQTLDQDSLDRSLFQTLLIAAGVGLLLCVIWLILRRCMPRLFAPNLYKETAKGKKLLGCWLWLRPMFTVSNDFLFYHRGMDALMFMTFVRMMLILMSCFFFFGVIILWPVDGTSSNRKLPPYDPNYVNGTAILTMSDINAETEPERFTAHLISVIFNSIICYILFVRTWLVYSKYTRLQWKQPEPANYTVLIDNVTSKLSEAEIFDILNKQFPGEVLSVHRMMRAYPLHVAFIERLAVDDIKAEALYNIEAAKKEVEKKREKGKDVKDPKDPEMHDVDSCVPCQAMFCCKPKVDVLDWAKRKRKESNKRMRKLTKKLEPTPCVMATFKTRDAAVRGASTAFTHYDRLWYSQPAPDWLDLRWANFEYSHRSRNTRYVLVLIFAICLGIMFFIPITFAQGLANLATLAKIPGFGFLLKVVELFPGATSIIEGILPSLVITIAFAIAKVILSKIVIVERYFTKSNALRSFTSKYFFLLVLNVFLASIAAGTFITLFESVKDIVGDPLSIMRLLAQRLPSQVNFFINYMAVNMVISNLIPILQPVRLIRRLLSRFFGIKTWTARNWMMLTNWFHYHEEYPIQMLYFTITISYSSLAPLIVPFALIFFAVKYFVSTYNIFYIYKRRWDGYGKYWPSVFNRLIVSMLLYQALMTGIFALQVFVPGFVICAIFMCLTVLYAIAVNRWFNPDLERRSVETIPTEHDNINLKLLENYYRDPVRGWEITKKTEWNDGVWYTTRDRLHQLQLSQNHPEFYETLQDIRRGHLVYSAEIHLQDDIDDIESGSSGSTMSRLRERMVDHSHPLNELIAMEQTRESAPVSLRGSLRGSLDVPSKRVSAEPPASVAAAAMEVEHDDEDDSATPPISSATSSSDDEKEEAPEEEDSDSEKKEEEDKVSSSSS